MTADRLHPELKSPHRWAVALCCATFPLIWVGGLVTTYDAGMAVEDWPTTYGYNLFLYPWTTWVAGPWDLFIEHGHRLLGSLVGLLTLGFCFSVFWNRCSSNMKVLAVVAVLGVVAQGVLGGMRVLLDARDLAMLHGCLGPTFFAFTAALMIVTSQRWSEAGLHRPVDISGLQRIAWLTAGMAWLQLLLGAQVRHVPVTASPLHFRAMVIFHLLLAVVLTVHVFWLAARSWSTDRRAPADQKLGSFMLRPVSLLAVLITVQLLLGAGTWIVKYGWPVGLQETTMTAGHLVQAQGMVQAMLVTGHVAVGSLILATSLASALRLSRHKRQATLAVSSGALMMGYAS